MTEINENLVNVFYRKLDINMQSIIPVDLYRDMMITIRDFIPTIINDMRTKVHNYNSDAIQKLISSKIETYKKNAKKPAEKFVKSLFMDDAVCYTFKSNIEGLINRFWHEIQTGKEIPESELNKCAKSAADEVLSSARKAKMLTGCVQSYKKACAALKKNGLKAKIGKNGASLFKKPGSPAAARKIIKESKPRPKGGNVLINTGKKMFNWLKKLIIKKVI